MKALFVYGKSSHIGWFTNLKEPYPSYICDGSNLYKLITSAVGMKDFCYILVTDKLVSKEILSK